MPEIDHDQLTAIRQSDHYGHLESAIRTAYGYPTSPTVKPASSPSNPTPMKSSTNFLAHHIHMDEDESSNDVIN